MAPPNDLPSHVHGDSLEQEATSEQEASREEVCDDENALAAQDEPEARAEAWCHYGEASAEATSCDSPCCMARCPCCCMCKPACLRGSQPEVLPLEVVQIEHDAHVVEHGHDALMIDGDPETYVRYRVKSDFFDVSTQDMYIWFSINDVRRIRGIEVLWLHSKGRGTQYATDLSVGVSAASEPGPPPAPMETDDAGPTPPDTAWTYIQPEVLTRNTGGRQFIDLSGKLPLAQHVVLWLNADAAVGLDELYAIAEVIIHPAQ